MISVSSGRPVRLPLPVPLFHHQASVDFVSRSIDTAFGENKGVEISGENTVDAVDVEAREIQDPIFARIGNEADVIAEPRHIHDRLFFVLVLIDRSKAHATVGRSQVRFGLRSRCGREAQLLRLPPAGHVLIEATKTSLL